VADGAPEPPAKKQKPVDVGASSSKAPASAPAKLASSGKAPAPATAAEPKPKAPPKSDTFQPAEPLEGAMNASGTGTGVDHRWRNALAKMFKQTPLPKSLKEAIQGLSAVGVDVEELEGVLKGKAMEWRSSKHLKKIGLPDDYSMDMALAIYTYTLQTPNVYSPLNAAMFSKDRRGADGTTSPALLAVMPYAKFLDTALERLPPSFAFEGDVERGVRWVFPSPDHHDPAKHFPKDGFICWYEFKSTSTNTEVMTRDHFAGMGPGPRTIFLIESKRGYSIKHLSFFGENEAEVLFRPGTLLKVTKVRKRILDPKYGTKKNEKDAKKSGFPDEIQLEEVVDDDDDEQDGSSF